MLNYTLGTIEASEALIKDLYIDLRAKVNAWSKITQQTPQARMGYVGQQLMIMFGFFDFWWSRRVPRRTRRPRCLRGPLT